MTNRYRENQNYVAAPPAPVVRRVEILPPEPGAIELHAPAQTIQRLNTSHRDRAVAFNISTLGLSAIVSLGGLLLIVAGWGVPVLSVTALAIFFGIAALTWLIAWLWFNAASPDGIGLIGVLLHYRLLRHEQRARLDRIDEMMDGDR